MNDLARHDRNVRQPTKKYMSISRFFIGTPQTSRTPIRTPNRRIDPFKPNTVDERHSTINPSKSNNVEDTKGRKVQESLLPITADGNLLYTAKKETTRPSRPYAHVGKRGPRGKYGHCRKERWTPTWNPRKRTNHNQSDYSLQLSRLTSATLPFNKPGIVVAGLILLLDMMSTLLLEMVQLSAVAFWA